MASQPTAVPPQVCSLALAMNGLSALSTHWARITGVDLTPLPLACALVAASLIATYASNLLRCPEAVWQDFGNTAALPALSAAMATMSALSARFLPGFMLAPLGLQVCLVGWYVLALVISARFLSLCYQKGQCPDPTWFPALLLPLMGYASSQAHGPSFMKAPEHFLAWTVAMVFVLVCVTYRIVLSPTRHSVTPNAAMALFMAPCSFFCMMHLSTGKPYGDAVGLMLFGSSTAWFMLTLHLLFSRRHLWLGAFHPSYVSFTFPAASTATAALLASERLPGVAGSTARAWAGVLSAVTFVVVPMILIRFLVLLVRLLSASGSPPSQPTRKRETVLKRPAKKAD